MECCEHLRSKHGQSDHNACRVFQQGELVVSGRLYRALTHHCRKRRRSRVSSLEIASNVAFYSFGLFMVPRRGPSPRFSFGPLLDMAADIAKRCCQRAKHLVTTSVVPSSTHSSRNAGLSVETVRRMPNIIPD